ncbi:MAG: acetate--CoA ligase [Bacteroidetes bacterium]|nr:acetate--CoA ligase [Bacteroidota bacterium]
MSFHIRSFEAYQAAWKKSQDSPDAFWRDIADSFDWMEPFSSVKTGDFNADHVRWFEGGKVNITANALDRHLPNRAQETAIIWEPNDPQESTRTLTYGELHAQTCQFGNALKSLGIKKGDRVVLYMPMTPELTIAVLACARIGAVHSVVFAGFSAQALSDRIEDAQAKVVITADEGRRGAKTIPLKATVDAATAHSNCVKSVVVQKITGAACHMESEKSVYWHDLVAGHSTVCPPEPMDSEDLLFILYTSGSTGKPKGVVHVHGGYMVYAGYSFSNVFQYQPGDVYWCTADVGWITGHSYIIYGPLLNGATSLMFEGIPTYPDAGRFWEICAKHQVNQFYTAPTAIRSLMASGTEPVLRHDLSSLKVLGTVGEPINEEAWQWYHDTVGKKRCPIVDTWWQTETGGIMISGLGSLSPMKPAHAGYPLPGIHPVLLDPSGQEITENNAEGLLCIAQPWPSMIRTTYGDHERCRNTYFRPFPGHYFTGDGAKRDEQGLYRIIGRVDDVINVSGHRFGTAEIESAINETSGAIESAVVSYPHDIKGQGIHAFVILDATATDMPAIQLQEAVRNAVIRGIGKIACPDRIQFVTALPKTRSGKIMRRILRKVAEGEHESFGDISTLLDPGCVDLLVRGAKQLQTR